MIAHLLGLCPLPARPRSAPVRRVRVMDREPSAPPPATSPEHKRRTRADMIAAQLDAAHAMLCAAPFPLRRLELASALNISAEHAGYLLYKLGKAGRANCIGLGAASAWVPTTERAA